MASASKVAGFQQGNEEEFGEQTEGSLIVDAPHPVPIRWFINQYSCQLVRFLEYVDPRWFPLSPNNHRDPHTLGHRPNFGAATK